VGARKKINYSRPARMRLISAQREYKTKIEHLIRQQKYIPGEEEIEVTASDIERALRQLRIVTTRSVDFRSLIIRLYLVTGVITVIVGLFYERAKTFVTFITANPIRLSLVAVGGMIIVVALLFRQIYEKKLYRREIEQHISKERYKEPD